MAVCSYDYSKRRILILTKENSSQQVIDDLRKSLAWLDLALATLNEGVLVLDDKMKILFANDAVADMVGKSRIFLLGLPVWDAVPIYDNLTRLTRSGYIKIRTNATTNKVYTLKTPGTELKIELSVSYIANTRQTVMVVRNVTKLLEAEAQRIKAMQEKAAREAAEYSARRILVQYKAASLLTTPADKSQVIKQVLKTICENLDWQVGIMWTVDDTGRELYAAQWFVRLKSMDGFIQASKRQSFRKGEGQPGMVWQRNEPMWSEDFASEPMFPRKDAALESNLHGSFAVPIKNGDIFLGVMEFFTERSIKPDQDLLTSMTTVGIQVAQYLQRKKYEQELRHNENKFRALTEKSAEVVSLKNAEGKITYTSPAVENILGYSPKEFVALENPFDLVHPDERKRVIGEFMELVKKPGAAITTEYRFRNKAGKYLWFEGSVTNLLHDEDVRAIVSNFRNITERKQSEQQIMKMNAELEQRVHTRTAELTIANKELARSNTELQDFAYVASHDLQEPLRKITAFSNLLEIDYKDDLPAGAHQYLTALKRASSRMTTLLTDMLTYSRVTTQAQPFKDVDLNEVVKDVLEDLQIRIEDTHAKITIHKLCTLEADRMQMRHLLQNLLSNALKYVQEETTPEITVSTKKKGGTCILAVQDNGIGFKEVYLDRIFTIFQRLHGRDQYEGTGVGLAICKKIVDRHGGTITAKSQVGKGSTFIITLPLKQLSS